MPAEPLTIGEVRETVHQVLNDREPRIRERVAEQIRASERLVKSRLETFAARVSSETAERIAALWRNGDGIGGVKTQLAVLTERQEELLDRLESLGRNGCGAHPLPIAPVPGETSSARRSVTDQSKVPATWGEWFLLIPWWAYPVGILVLLVVGPDAWERLVWLANKIGGN